LLRANPATDGLLLDLHLPDGSGLDFLRDLRKQGGTARLPVVVLTAEGEDRILREARRLGATLVTKPFSPTKLSQRIAMCLAMRNRRRREYVGRDPRRRIGNAVLAALDAGTPKQLLPLTATGRCSHSRSRACGDSCHPSAR